MSQTEQDYPLPPATFGFLVASIVMQAQVNLGMLHFGDEADRPAPNIPMARHAIDLLAMLQEKTRGNITYEEQRELENSLTELRFRFVQALEHKTTDPPDEIPDSSAASSS